MLRWPQLLVGYCRFLRRFSPERMIHTNWQHVLLLWPMLKPERDLFWLHEVVPNKPQYRKVFGWLARRLGCIVCVSNAVARSLAAIGIPPGKVRVIHNGLRDPAPAGERRPVSQGPLRIGIVGQVGAWKGHEDLLEAFAAIVKRQPATELHIFGSDEGEFADTLKARSQALGCASRVVWHGFVSDRGGIYPATDICVVPSPIPEPFGLVAVEAAYFGLPVVATRLGGLPEIVEDGVTGFLVEAGNPPQLEARLDELLNSAELRSRMGAAARQRAEAHFSRERFVGDFIRLLGDARPVA